MTEKIDHRYQTLRNRLITPVAVQTVLSRPMFEIHMFEICRF